MIFKQEPAVESPPELFNKERSRADQKPGLTSMPLSGAPLESAAVWKVGDLCIAQWSADAKWYNAQIVARDEFTGLYQVLFTDYGNDEAGLDSDRLRSASFEVPSSEQISLLYSQHSFAAALSHPSLESTSNSDKISEVAVPPAAIEEIVKIKLFDADFPKWRVGDLCVAQWSEDAQWYKAQIIARDESTGLYQVLFTDYGNDEAGLGSDRIRSGFPILQHLPLPIAALGAQFMAQLAQAASGAACFFNSQWGHC
jgi:hypothetical protein